MDIKLVLVDIDGTLLNSKGQVTPKTIEAISKLKDKNIMFGIATGRTPYAVKNLIYDWGIDQYVDMIMGFNGGSCLDMHSGKTNSCYLLDGKYMDEIMSDFKGFDFNVGIYEKETYHVLKEDERAIDIAKRNKLELIVDDLSSFKDKQVEKILFMSKPEINNQMEEYYKNNIHTTHYRAVKSTPILLEFLNPELSKSKGIDNICQNLNITKDNILTFGDELNDYEMIRDCIGVAMGNSNPKIKEIATYVTLSNDEDGIGEFLNQYIL